MDGVQVSLRAAEFFRERWPAQLHGHRHAGPGDGSPVMHALGQTIRGCPPPLEMMQAGHFVQEHGREVAEAALRHSARSDQGTTQSTW